MDLTYSHIIFLYLSVAFVISLYSFINIHRDLSLLSNRKFRQDRPMLRAKIKLSKKVLYMSLVWPALLVIISSQSLKMLKATTTTIQVKSVDSNSEATVLPSRPKPPQSRRRN